MSTHHQLSHSSPDVRELLGEDLDLVGGGMKWVRGTVNPDVIDARGGQWSLWNLTWTRDINGKVSSIGIR